MTGLNHLDMLARDRMSVSRHHQSRDRTREGILNGVRHRRCGFTTANYDSSPGRRGGQCRGYDPFRRRGIDCNLKQIPQYADCRIKMV